MAITGFINTVYYAMLTPKHMTESATNTFVYFAYGSNMLSHRLKERAPSAVAIGIGFVQGRRLAFDKVSSDGSGKCDIEVTINPKDRAYGVLFNIASTEKSILDKVEGLGKGYDKQDIQVVTTNGACTAVTYVATTKEPALRPYHWYKALVVAGAVQHGLPNVYIEWLRTFKSQADPHTKRRAENEALLLAANTSLNTCFRLSPVLHDKDA